jgi:hypothetical protein
MDPPRNLRDLTSADWDRLQNYIECLEGAWQEAKEDDEPLVLKNFLPPEDDPLHTVVLHELILTDLEFRWRRGLRGSLKEYLHQFRELGDPETLPPQLIYEEYRVRQRYGDPLALEDYEQLYPRQFVELQRLVKEQPVPEGRRPRSPPAPLVLPGDKGRERHGEKERFIQSTPGGSKVLSLGGGYRLLKRIGGGTFGEVWRAEGPTGAKVAVKIIYGPITPEEASQREMPTLEAMKRLCHASLLRIYEYWQLDDRLIIAMELADGSLRDLLKKRRKKEKLGIPMEKLLWYFREAAEAIDHLHASQMLHRDIKPENILVISGHVRVADFGLAQLVEQSRGIELMRRWWRSDYLAPEIISHGQVGAQSDQYSLAASYAELRLNRSLFPSTSLYETIESHLKRIPDLSPLEPVEQQVLQRALAKDPCRRYRTCGEFVQELEKALTANRQDRGRPSVRRQVLVVLLLLLSSLAVVGFLTVYIAFRRAMGL